jgi:hypothetical protein
MDRLKKMFPALLACAGLAALSWYLHPKWHNEFGAWTYTMPVYCWLVLGWVGVLNDLAQRSESVRAMSLWQMVPNFLKDKTPFGKLPVFRQLLELLDTPGAEPKKEPATPPPTPPQ